MLFLNIYFRKSNRQVVYQFCTGNSHGWFAEEVFAYCGVVEYRPNKYKAVPYCVRKRNTTVTFEYGEAYDVDGASSSDLRDTTVLPLKHCNSTHAFHSYIILHIYNKK